MSGKEIEASRFEHFLRLLTVVTQVIEVYIYGGLVFGFNTLIYILRKESIYSSLCEDEILNSSNGTFVNETQDFISCNAQDVVFTQVAIVGMIAFYISIFSGGILYDNYGLWLVRTLFSMALTAGGVALAFTKVYEPLLYIVACAWGAQAALALLCSLPTANLFPGFRSTIITFLVGCFDSSSSVLVYYQILYDQGIADMSATPIIYILSGMFVLVRTITLVPYGTIPQELPNDYVLSNETVLRKLRNNSVDPIMKKRLPEEDDIEVTKSKLSILKEIFSRLDVYTAIFICVVSAIRQSMFVSTFNKWTRFVEDSAEVEQDLTLIFGFMGYSELAFTVLPGLLMDVCSRSSNPYIDRRAGITLCLGVSIILHLVCNITWGQSGSTVYAIIAILCYYAFRSFFFSTFQAAIGEMFPSEMFGTMTGLFTISMMPCVMAVPSIFSYTINSGRDFSFLANIENVFALISILHPIAIMRRVYFEIENEKAEKQKIEIEFRNSQP